MDNIKFMEISHGIKKLFEYNFKRSLRESFILFDIFSQ